MRLIIEILTFLIVVAVTFAVTGEVERIVKQKRRLGEGDFAGRSPSGSLLNPDGVDNRFFQWVQSSTSISDPTERQKLRLDLSMAGFDQPSAPVWYVISRFVLGIGLPATFLLVETLLPHPITGFFLVFWALILCVVGLVFPANFVSRRAKARRIKLEFEFPDALDLMVVCVEAGLSMDATFVRVRQEVRESHPLIAQQFSKVSDELHAGRSRTDALRAMADRTAVAGIKSFVTLVIQTEALGASIAQTLRTYSNEMRETRYIRAEEKAMRIPVLMTVPLVACMLPVIVTAVMLPVIIDVIRTLIPALVAHHGGG